jgi:hypothetical protein
MVRFRKRPSHPAATMHVLHITITEGMTSMIADKSLQVEFPRHHSRIVKDSLFCFFDLDWVIFS